MIDHDPGDEDRNALPTEFACAFCQLKLKTGRWYRVPVRLYEPPWPHFEPAPLDSFRKDWEDLITCKDCRSVAERFAKSQAIDPEWKRVHRLIRVMERERGLIP